MTEEIMQNTDANIVNSIDINKIIAEIIMKNEERWFAALKNAAVDIFKRSQIRLGNAFEIYLKRAYEKYSKVKTILYKNEPRYIYDFFVANDLRIRGEKNELLSCNSVNNLINNSRYNVILGTGGTGKSMMMRHFFLDSLFNEELVPIFVELRNIQTNQKLDEYIYEIVHGLGFDLEMKYFEIALKDGRFLLLLDGYDEICEEEKLYFYKELERTCDCYPNNYYIVSSRDDGCFIGWQRFSVYETIKLSKDKAIELISKLDYDEELKNKFVLELKNGLYKKNKSFASNPLLLNIMLLTFDNYAEIPSKRHIFYANAFDTLYSVHDATKGGFKRGLKSALSSSEFKNVFGEFCFITYIKSKVEFPPEEITEMIGGLKSLPKGLSVENFVDDLTTSVCLMYIDGRNYVFSHRSFQEYFAALYIANMPDELQRTVCERIMSRNLTSIETDSVFEMMLDMNPERFNKNVTIPYLTKLNMVLQYQEESLKKYLTMIDRISFINIKHVDGFEEFDMAFSVRGYEKTSNFMLVKFRDDIISNMVFFIVENYKKYTDTPRPQIKKLDVKYLCNKYSISDVFRDSTLYAYICDCEVGRLLKCYINLLDKLNEEQAKINNDVDSILALIN